MTSPAASNAEQIPTQAEIDTILRETYTQTGAFMISMNRTMSRRRDEDKTKGFLYEYGWTCVITVEKRNTRGHKMPGRLEDFTGNAESPREAADKAIAQMGFAEQLYAEHNAKIASKS